MALAKATTIRDYDYLFKLLIIGDSGAGKSALLFRFADNIFPTSFMTTVGVDFRIRTVNINGDRVKLQIWDTAGQERFRTITSTYYRGTHGVIIVYDVTNGESFRNVMKWTEEIEANCDMISKVLVGNKNDDEFNKIVLEGDAQRLADQLDMPFFEVSAKENVGVEEMFMAITQEMLQERKKHISEDKRQDVIHLGNESERHRHQTGSERRGRKSHGEREHSLCC